MFESFVSFVRDLYQTPDGWVPLHAPRFIGREKEYLLDCIDSTFVSSVGEYVDRFEQQIAEFTGAAHAVAVVNGTNAIHIALRLVGVSAGDWVITQPLTFVATCNAIRYQGAHPLFVDIDAATLGLSASKLASFLAQEAFINDQGECQHRASGRRIAACLPMHTFGLPAQLDEIQAVCQQYHIPLVEDAAESLGSHYRGKHTGTFGVAGALSFNGNKIMTSGGGGVIVTNDADFAQRAKHLTTQAKQPHAWEYVHNEVGYNYRMPNLNAALACAQLEMIPKFLEKKRKVAQAYADFFAPLEATFVTEPSETVANYWLNTILLRDKEERDAFLTYTNDQQVMTRPAWQLMHRLPMFDHTVRGDLSVAEGLMDQLVNIPSSVPLYE